jgi:HlyD family secretion protein
MRAIPRFSALKRRLPWLAGGLLLAGLAVALLLRGGPGAVAVETAEAVATELRPTLFGLGLVEARRSVLVGPTVAGRVLRVHGEPGDTVAAGQLLAEMDPVDLGERLAAARHALVRVRATLASAQAQIEESESRRLTAEASAQRFAALRAQGFVSGEAERARAHEARAAGAAWRGSLAGREAAAAEVERLAAEVAALERQLANTRLHAPAAGLIVAREIEAGSTAVAGQAVLRLADDAAFWLRVRVDQGRSAGLAVGLPAAIVLRSRPGETLPGRVARIEPLSDAVTEERVAMIAFDAPPSGLTLNELAEVTLSLPPRRAGVVVPPAALVRHAGQSGVFVAADGRARFVPVRPGVRTGEGVEILDGLPAGTAVVTARARALDDGDRLRLPRGGA